MASFTGTNGNDTIIPGTISPGVVIGGSPPFDLSGNDIVSGLGGLDLLNGGGGDDTVLGGSGDDNLGGGTGVDSLDGGTGNDTLSGFDEGGTFSDTLHGGDDDDRVTARATDRAFGDAGDDTLVVRESGIFQLDGGSGTDTLEVSGNRSIVGATLTSVETLRLVNSGVTLTTSQLGQFTTIEGDSTIPFNPDIVLAAGGTAVIELLLVGIGIRGSAEADHLTFGSGSTSRVTFEGKDGDDSAVAPGAGGSLFGGDGDDILIGNAGHDDLRGNDGDDLLDGGGFDDAGTDVLNGGEGDDTLRIGNTDLASGRKGDDLFEADVTTGSFFIGGGSGTDTIDVQEGGADFTAASIRNIEILRIGSGDVTLLASQAEAFNVVDLVSDGDPGELNALRLASSGTVAITLDDGPGPLSRFALVGAADADLLSIHYLSPGTVAGAVELAGRGGNDTLTGGQVGERLVGGSGDDILSGSAGKDKLEGNSGDDVIRGGSGRDELNGGGGLDVYVYGESGGGSDKVHLTDGTDLIRFEIVDPSGDEIDTVLDSAVQIGSTVRVQLNTTTITLLDFTLAQLDENDFQVVDIA